MKCEFCKKDINSRMEGHFELKNVTYYGKKNYAYINIMKKDGESEQQDTNQIIREENKLVYCEECYNSRVKLRS